MITTIECKSLLINIGFKLRTNYKDVTLKLFQTQEWDLPYHAWCDWHGL